MTRRYLLSMAVALFAFLHAFTGEAQTDAETPKESRISIDLRIGLVVFLCFHDAAEQDLGRIKGEIQAIADNFKGVIDAVYVSGDDKKEDSLRKKFNVRANETAVFIIIPPGKVVAELEGADITRSNLMGAFISSCGAGGCGSGCGSR